MATALLGSVLAASGPELIAEFRVAVAACSVASLAAAISAYALIAKLSLGGSQISRYRTGAHGASPASSVAPGGWRSPVPSLPLSARRSKSRVKPADYRESYAVLTGQRIDLCPDRVGRMVEIGLWPRSQSPRPAPPRCDTS